MTLIYGHRGAKGEAPENTLASFQRCLEHGVDRCEGVAPGAVDVEAARQARRHGGLRPRPPAPSRAAAVLRARARG